MVRQKEVEAAADNYKTLKVDAIESFMSDVFSNHMTAKTHLDTKINWLMGVSGLTVSLLIQYLHGITPSIRSVGLYIILFTSMITFFICLLSLQLPRFLIRNSPEKQGVMFYHKNVQYTPEMIHDQLKSIKNYDDVLKQYSIALYNLIERNIKIKDRLFRMSAYTLTTGLTIGFIAVLLTI